MAASSALVHRRGAAVSLRERSAAPQFDRAAPGLGVRASPRERAGERTTPLPKWSEINNDAPEQRVCVRAPAFPPRPETRFATAPVERGGREAGVERHEATILSGRPRGSGAVPSFTRGPYRAWVPSLGSRELREKIALEPRDPAAATGL
ncbi:hypothetical protein MTO96_013815 [Rhipicephalus appendiculatus]